MRGSDGSREGAAARAESDQALRTAAQALGVLALALALAYAVFFVYHAALTIAFPYDLDWGEGYVLNDAMRLARGEPLYADIRDFPMVRSPYPPLFLAVDALLMQVLGTGFLAGRLLSTASTLAIAVLAWRLARCNGAATLPAALAGLVVLASPHVYQWGPYSRVDMLAVALSLLGLYLASGASDRRRLALAGLVTCAALFTKQTVISVPVGVCLALLLTRPRSLSWFLLGLLVPAGALLTLVAAATDGEFIRHVVTGNAGNPTNLARLVRFELEFALLHPLLLIGGLGFALTQLVARRPSPLATSTLVAWIVSLSVASEASSVNYFMELVPLVSAAAAVAWTRFAVRDAGRAMLAAGLVVVQLAIVFHVPNTVGVWPSFFAPHGYTPTVADAAVGREIDASIRAAPGWVISEPAGFAIRNGKDVLLQPLDLRAEQLRGRWSSDILRQAVRERRFSVVVVSYGLFPEDVLAELRGAYVLDRTVASPNGLRYSVYRPGS